MEHYLILARSVTFAQRMQRALGRAGIHSRMFRAPRELSELGCAYAVQIAVRDLPSGLQAIRRASLTPVKVYLYQNRQYREVEL